MSIQFEIALVIRCFVIFH